MERSLTRSGWLPALVLAWYVAAAPAQEPVGADGVLDNADVEQVEEPGKRIYRTVDRHGNPVFTDTPPESGPVEEVQVTPGNTLPMRTPSPPAPVQEAPEAARYQLAITAPEHEQTFRNPVEPIMVRVSLAPRLEAGHRLVVTANGEPLPGSPGQGYSYREPERGAHRIQARVMDGDRVVAEAEEVIIYVHRTSALRQSSASTSGSAEGARRRAGYDRDDYPGRDGYRRTRPAPGDTDAD